MPRPSPASTVSRSAALVSVAKKQSRSAATALSALPVNTASAGASAASPVLRPSSSATGTVDAASLAAAASRFLADFEQELRHALSLHSLLLTHAATRRAIEIDAIVSFRPASLLSLFLNSGATTATPHSVVALLEFTESFVFKSTAKSAACRTNSSTVVSDFLSMYRQTACNAVVAAACSRVMCADDADLGSGCVSVLYFNCAQHARAASAASPAAVSRRRSLAHNHHHHQLCDLFCCVAASSDPTSSPLLKVARHFVGRLFSPALLDSIERQKRAAASLRLLRRRNGSVAAASVSEATPRSSSTSSNSSSSFSSSSARSASPDPQPPAASFAPAAAAAASASATEASSFSFRPWFIVIAEAGAVELLTAVRQLGYTLLGDVRDTGRSGPKSLRDVAVFLRNDKLPDVVNVADGTADQAAEAAAADKKQQHARWTSVRLAVPRSDADNRSIIVRVVGVHLHHTGKKCADDYPDLVRECGRSDDDGSDNAVTLCIGDFNRDPSTLFARRSAAASPSSPPPRFLCGTRIDNAIFFPSSSANGSHAVVVEEPLLCCESSSTLHRAITAAVFL